MVDGGAVDSAPPVKRKRGRPRKADLAAAAAAAAAATVDGGIAPSAVNGVPPPPAAVVAPAVLGVPVLKQEPKPRKSRKKKGEVTGPVGVDMNLVGKTVTGVLDGSFDGGYLVSVRVGDSETVLRGVMFGPGLIVPLSKMDIAPGVKVIKRDESILVPAPSPVSVLAPATAFPGASQTPPVAFAPAAVPTVIASPFPQVSAPAAATTPKALSSPTGATVPAASAVVSTESNSQVPVHPYPTTVPQAQTTPGP